MLEGENLLFTKCNYGNHKYLPMSTLCVFLIKRFFWLSSASKPLNLKEYNKLQLKLQCMWLCDFSFDKRERDSLDREVMELKKSNTVLDASLKAKVDELQEYQKEVFQSFGIRSFVP